MKFNDAIAFTGMFICLICLICLIIISNQVDAKNHVSETYSNFECLNEAPFYGIDLEEFHVSIQNDYSDEPVGFDPVFWGIPMSGVKYNN